MLILRLLCYGIRRCYAMTLEQSHYLACITGCHLSVSWKQFWHKTTKCENRRLLKKKKDVGTNVFVYGERTKMNEVKETTSGTAEPKWLEKYNFCSGLKILFQCSLKS